jgi:DNA primase
LYLDSFVKRAARSALEHEKAVAYMASRGFTVEDMKKWDIGFTRVARIPEGPSKDYQELKEATYGFKGLENRIIIPLKNALGNVNGLQTRALNEKRYVQLLMSEAKSIGAFFGLSEALPEIRAKRRVFVHEGAFNAMAFSKVFPQLHRVPYSFSRSAAI